MMAASTCLPRTARMATAVNHAMQDLSLRSILIVSKREANTPIVGVRRLRCQCRMSSSSHNYSDKASTPKFVSFIDQVNELMKREYPDKYELYLQGRKEALETLELSPFTEKSMTTNMPRHSSKTSNSNVKLHSDERSNRKEMVEKKREEILQESVSYADVASITGTSKDLKDQIDSDLFTKTSAPTRAKLTINTASNESNTLPTAKTSIFDTIYKNVHASNTNNTDSDKGSIGVLLSDLFPTLHKTNSRSSTFKKEEKPVIDPEMMYHPDHWEPYEQVMHAVLQEEKTEKILLKFQSKGPLEGRIVKLVKEYLLSDVRMVEKKVVFDRWNHINSLWRDGWSTGDFCMSQNTSVEGKKEGKNNDNYNSDSHQDGEMFDDDELFEGNRLSSESKFLSEMTIQQKIFLNKLLCQKSPPSFLSPTIQSEVVLTSDNVSLQFYQLLNRILSFFGRYCARRARSSPMEVAWYKIKECGLKLPEDTISTLLYVVSTMGMTDSLGFSSGVGSIGKPSVFHREQAVENVFIVPEEVATYHDLLSQPTESSVSLRIRALASQGDAKTAEDLLEAFKKSIQGDENSKEFLRLRTYYPILKHYCEENNVSAALSVFKKMQSTRSVILEPENYVLLLSMMAENGCFQNESSPIEGALSLGYRYSCGPELFDEIATEMSFDVLEISSASARRLYNAFAIGFKRESDYNVQDGDETRTVISTLKEAHPLAPISLSTDAAKTNELVVSRVLLDRSSGICPVTGAQQHLILLERDQRKQFHDNLLALAKVQYTNFNELRTAEKGIEKAAELLNNFSDWLNNRDGEPFTAIVDGANVGYYMQSFEKGRFNYHQIKFMVDTLEAKGENPLVVIPYKYGSRSFYSSRGQFQELDSSEILIMTKLINSGKLYRAPPRYLDDFYWMLASVSDQSTSRKGRDLSVPSSDVTGRWPGTRPALITNDQMRDHKLELLEPRLFRRWYGCHIVNYNFSAFVLGESVDGNGILFSQADFFSREIQGNECHVSLETKESMDASKFGGKAWHFPVTDWDLEERLVIRIPKYSQK